MAVTTNLILYDAADSNANWSELAGHLSGGAPAATSENFWHNGTAIDQNTGQGLNQATGMQCEAGTASWTASSNWVFLTWSKFDAGTNLFPWASGGYRIGIGSSSGNMNYYNAMGDDFGIYPSGGWQSTAIDPEFATPDQVDGTPVAGTYAVIGFMPNMRAKITKGSPNVADVIRYGRGDLIVTGTETFTSIASTDNASTTRWGLFYPQGGGFIWKGLLQLGSTGTSLSFTDSNKNIRVEDTPRVLAGFNKIEVINAATSVTWNTISITGVQTSITGSAPVSKGNFEVVSGDVFFDSCTFTDLGTFVFLNGTSSVTSCIFRRCENVATGGTTLTSSTFTNSTATSAVTTDNLEKLSACTFISSGTGHGVELTSLGSGTMAWSCNDSGYASTDGSTGNETIFVNVGTGSLTINVADTATTPTIRTAGASVTVVAGQKTFTVSNIAENTEVRLYNAGNLTQIAGVELVADTPSGVTNMSVAFTGTDSQGIKRYTASYSYTYTADTPIIVVAHNLNYQILRLNSSLLNENRELPINQIFDRNYDEGSTPFVNP